MKKFVLVLACLLASYCTLFATGSSESEPLPAENGDYEPLRFVTSFRIKSLDPISQGFWLAEYGVSELLMQFRDDGQHYPWLLSSLDLIDDLTWVLTIRDGITFQNGKPVDADAVLAVMNRQMELSSSAQSRIPDGTIFEKKGELEITLRTPEPFPGLISALSHEATFPIYDVEMVESVGENYEELAGSGFYTGPFQVVSLDDQSLILERNEMYWAGRPELPGVEVTFVSDAQARILAVQNSEADVVCYPPSSAKPAVDAMDGVEFIYGWPSGGGFRAILNTQKAPFDDVAVRKAVIRSIDYDQIADAVMDGVVKAPRGYYPDWLPFAIENQYTDIDEAGQILEEAGWTVGKDGIREKNGESLNIDLLIYPQQPDLGPISEAMQATMRQAGFNVRIQVVDSIRDALEKGSIPWDIGITSAGAISFGGSPEDPLMVYNHSNGPRNWAHHSNPELDALIEELSVTFEEKARALLLEKIQHVLIEEDPQQFFVEFHTQRHIVSEEYRNYHPGMALYFVHYLTKPGPYETPDFSVR